MCVWIWVFVYNPGYSVKWNNAQYKAKCDKYMFLHGIAMWMSSLTCVCQYNCIFLQLYCMWILPVGFSVQQKKRTFFYEKGKFCSLKGVIYYTNCVSLVDSFWFDLVDKWCGSLKCTQRTLRPPLVWNLHLLPMSTWVPTGTPHTWFLPKVNWWLKIPHRCLSQCDNPVMTRRLKVIENRWILCGKMISHNN